MLDVCLALGVSIRGGSFPVLLIKSSFQHCEAGAGPVTSWSQGGCCCVRHRGHFLEQEDMLEKQEKEGLFPRVSLSFYSLLQQTLVCVCFVFVFQLKLVHGHLSFIIIEATEVSGLSWLPQMTISKGKGIGDRYWIISPSAKDSKQDKHNKVVIVLISSKKKVILLSRQNLCIDDILGCVTRCSDIFTY